MPIVEGLDLSTDFEWLHEHRLRTTLRTGFTLFPSKNDFSHSLFKSGSRFGQTTKILFYLRSAQNKSVFDLGNIVKILLSKNKEENLIQIKQLS